MVLPLTSFSIWPEDSYIEVAASQRRRTKEIRMEVGNAVEVLNRAALSINMMVSENKRLLNSLQGDGHVDSPVHYSQ